jgi:hypothetical protein
MWLPLINWYSQLHLVSIRPGYSSIYMKKQIYFLFYHEITTNEVGSVVIRLGASIHLPSPIPTWYKSLVIWASLFMKLYFRTCMYLCNAVNIVPLCFTIKSQVQWCDSNSPVLLQKEIALYTASKFNSEFCWFDIDGDIDPLFKVRVMNLIPHFFDTFVS